MKLTTLIPMTDFVNQIGNMENYPGHEEVLKWIYNYATFLKQPLKLEMFVPCDDEGNALSEPKDWKVYESGGSAFMNIDEILPCQEYKKAKEKVLFEGFELEGSYLMYYGFMYAMTYELANKTIESIIDDIPNNPLQLTPTAIKQIQKR